MPNYTTNFGLVKPKENEFYDINQFNSNSDVIDTELKKITTGAGDAVVAANNALEIAEIAKPKSRNAPPCETDDNTNGFIIGSSWTIPEIVFSNLIDKAASPIIGNWASTNCSVAASGSNLILTASNVYPYAKTTAIGTNQACPGDVYFAYARVSVSSVSAVKLSLIVEDDFGMLTSVSQTNPVINQIYHLGQRFVLPISASGNLKFSVKLEYTTTTAINGKVFSLQAPVLINMSEDMGVGLEFSVEQGVNFVKSYFDIFQTKNYAFGGMTWICSDNSTGKAVWNEVKTESADYEITPGVEVKVGDVVCLENGKIVKPRGFSYPLNSTLSEGERLGLKLSETKFVHKYNTTCYVGEVDTNGSVSYGASAILPNNYITRLNQNQIICWNEGTFTFYVVDVSGRTFGTPVAKTITISGAAPNVKDIIWLEDNKLLISYQSTAFSFCIVTYNGTSFVAGTPCEVTLNITGEMFTRMKRVNDTTACVMSYYNNAGTYPRYVRLLNFSGTIVAETSRITVLGTTSTLIEEFLTPIGNAILVRNQVNLYGLPISNNVFTGEIITHAFSSVQKASFVYFEKLGKFFANLDDGFIYLGEFISGQFVFTKQTKLYKRANDISYTADVKLDRAFWRGLILSGKLIVLTGDRMQSSVSAYVQTAVAIPVNTIRFDIDANGNISQPVLAGIVTNVLGFKAKIAADGIYNGFTNLKKNRNYYLQADNTISTMPTTIRVGYAVSDTVFKVDVEDECAF